VRLRSPGIAPARQIGDVRRLVDLIRANSTDFEANGRVLRLKQCAPPPPSDRFDMLRVHLRLRKGARLEEGRQAGRGFLPLVGCLG